VEVVVVIAILGILLAIAVPNMSVYIINQKIRTAANSIQNGLQLARSEAVNRNQSVGFVLTAAAPTSGSVTPSSTGANWVIRPESATNTLLQGRSAGEGSSNVTISATAGGTALSTPIVFNSLGRLGTAGTVQIDMISIGADRPLRVLVSTGGQIRMCEPALPAGNLQGCS
jgi:type IV fimbrial biogenesis protein FimT